MSVSKTAVIVNIPDQLTLQSFFLLLRLDQWDLSSALPSCWSESITADDSDGQGREVRGHGRPRARGASFHRVLSCLFQLDSSRSLCSRSWSCPWPPARSCPEYPSTFLPGRLFSSSSLITTRNWPFAVKLLWLHAGNGQGRYNVLVRQTHNPIALLLCDAFARSCVSDRNYSSL